MPPCGAALRVLLAVALPLTVFVTISVTVTVAMTDGFVHAGNKSVIHKTKFGPGDATNVIDSSNPETVHQQSSHFGHGKGGI